MRRVIFSSEHEAFRRTVRSFYRDELAPQFSEWELGGQPPRSFWRKAGELGLTGIQVPEGYGGAGVASFLFNAILTEEAQAAGLALGGLRVHTDICTPYFLRYASSEQCARWLPRLASGDAVSAIAISEPGAGSDMRAISTTAVRDGDRYIVNGSKTFISNGATADLIITAVKTGPPDGRDGISLLVIDGNTQGLCRGRQLQKMGLKAQDVSELSFTDAQIPVADLLGEEGRGFEYLTANLPQERLSIAVNSQAAAAEAVRGTISYVKERAAFGVPISSFQNTKFELASCATEVEAGQALIDRALQAHDAGELTAADAAKVKLFCAELQCRVVDRCLQLHGGYGYMLEYPIARAYVDARASRIYGGSSEVMKVLVARSLGL
jgi:acyl-CoA dehydrogenase